eukprot:Clim_evm44s147 gene=Clim_evmTU44s147
MAADRSRTFVFALPLNKSESGDLENNVAAVLVRGTPGQVEDVRLCSTAKPSYYFALQHSLRGKMLGKDIVAALEYLETVDPCEGPQKGRPFKAGLAFVENGDSVLSIRHQKDGGRYPILDEYELKKVAKDRSHGEDMSSKASTEFMLHMLEDRRFLKFQHREYEALASNSLEGFTLNIRNLHDQLDSRDQLEVELVQNFLPILNEKKERIRQLEEQLEALKFASSSEKPVPTNGKRVPPAKNFDEAMSVDEGDPDTERSEDAGDDEVADDTSEDADTSELEQMLNANNAAASSTKGVADGTIEDVVTKGHADEDETKSATKPGDDNATDEDDDEEGAVQLTAGRIRRRR